MLTIYPLKIKDNSEPRMRSVIYYPMKELLNILRSSRAQAQRRTCDNGAEGLFVCWRAEWNTLFVRGGKTSPLSQQQFPRTISYLGA